MSDKKRGRPIKIKTCAYCGAAFKGRHGKEYCAKCGMTNLIRNIEQQRLKAGPYYDKYVAGLAKHLMRVTGISEKELFLDDRTTKRSKTGK